jgi:hypothetical protein
MQMLVPAITGWVKNSGPSFLVSRFDDVAIGFALGSLGVFYFSSPNGWFYSAFECYLTAAVLAACVYAALTLATKLEAFYWNRICADPQRRKKFHASATASGAGSPSSTGNPMMDMLGKMDLGAMMQQMGGMEGMMGAMGGAGAGGMPRRSAGADPRVQEIE